MCESVAYLALKYMKVKAQIWSRMYPSSRYAFANLHEVKAAMDSGVCAVFLASIEWPF